MINISIEKLHHHPNNPRKDFGDLTELAESIKTRGILQNLTVVPTRESVIDTEYYVVIGNRRLEAAKLAGLKELPCQISYMSLKDQQATMLLENMQRNDLTPYEQAQGFQMCLDLGMDETELKVATGFSKKTIRHRLKMLELDEEKVKKATNATIQDYIDLEKVENIEKRNELMDYIGTYDFRYKLNSAVERERRKKLYEKGLKHISEIMEKVDEMPDGYTYFRYVNAKDLEKFELPDERKYVFMPYDYAFYVLVYVEDARHDEVKTEEPKEPTQKDLNVEKIKELVNNAYHTRLEFAKEIYNTLMMDISQNREYRALFGIVSNNLHVCDTDTAEVFKEVTYHPLNQIDNLDFRSHKQSIRLSFALAYSCMENKDDDSTVYANSWSSAYGHYDNAYTEEYKNLYDFLKLYGYKISDEEEQIMFGTHELYKNTEE